MKVYILLLTGFLSTLILSCNKEKSSGKSKKEILITREWVIKKFEEKDNTTPWVDEFPFWSACEKDNTWKFKPNFSMELNESAIACTGSTPNAILDEVTWSVIENETKITIESNTYNIERLDETTFIIVFSKILSGITYQTRITFEH